MPAATPVTGAVFTANRKTQSGKNLEPAEIEELGLELVIPVAEILEADACASNCTPIAVATRRIQYWKEKLDRLKRKVRR